MLASCFVDDVEVLLADAGARYSWVEAHDLFDDGDGVGEAIQEWRVGLDEGRCDGRVRSEYGGVFSAHPREYLELCGEDVDDVADGAAGGVVA